MGKQVVVGCHKQTIVVNNPLKMIRGIVDIRVVIKYIEVIVMLISLAIIVVAVGKCTPA